MRRKRKLTMKVLEARMQDIMNAPTPEDENSCDNSESVYSASKHGRLLSSKTLMECGD